MPTVTKLAVASTIARRIRTSRFDDENEPCSSFGVRRHYKSSVQFTLRSTTILTRNVISSPAKSTNRDARPRRPNGAQSWPDPHVEFLSRQTLTVVGRSRFCLTRL